MGRYVRNLERHLCIPPSKTIDERDDDDCLRHMILGGWIGGNVTYIFLPVLNFCMALCSCNIHYNLPTLPVVDPV